MIFVGLRPVMGSDKQFFAKWWRDRDLIALTSGNFSSLPDNQLERYFQEIVTQRDRVDRMIEVDGETIGHINVQGRSENWWELQIIIGAKDRWGKGYGPEAIRQLLQVLTSQGMEKVYLEVRPENTRAIGAYEKCGFAAVSRASHNNPNQPETIRMELMA